MKSNPRLKKTIKKVAADKAATVVSEKKNQIVLDNANAPLLTVKFLEQILSVMNRINLQLTEMNYYLTYLEPEEKKTSNDSHLIDYFAEKGFNLKPK